MAVEARVTQQYIQTLVEGDRHGRVTQQFVQFLAAEVATARVTQQFIQVLENDDEPVTIEPGSAEETEVIPTPFFLTEDGYFIPVGSATEVEDIPTPTWMKMYGQLRGVDSEEYVPTDVRFVRGGAAARIYIGGAEIPALPMNNTVNITRLMGAPGKASFKIFDDTQTLEIVKGADVNIYWRGYRVFGGIVTNHSRMSFQAKPVHVLSVECGGYATLLYRRFITDKIDISTFPEYNRNLKGVVDRLIYVYLKSRGDEIFFDYAGCPDIAITEPLVFSFESVGAALDKLAELTNTTWYEDIYKTVHYVKNDQAVVNAPFELTDDSDRWLTESLVIKEDLGDYSNVVIGRTATALAGTRTDTFMGNGDITQSFPLRYAMLPDTIPIVKVNGVQQIVVTEAEPTANFQFSFLPGYSIIYPRTNPPVNVPFALTDVIEITYQVQNKNAIEVRNDVAIGTQAAAEGGSGEWQTVLDLSDKFADLESAEAYLEAYLAKVSIPQRSATFMTNEMMTGFTLAEIMALDVGQLLHIDTTQPIADEIDVVVESITIRDVDGVFLSWDVAASSQRIRDAWDKKLAKMLANQTPQLNAQDIYGFKMAEDVIGFDNPGMVLTPTIQLATLVRRKCITLSCVLYTTAPPTTGKVSIQLYRNGVAILPTPIEWSSTTTEKVTMQLPGVTLEQYDLLGVRVLEIGSYSKNFQLILSTMPTGSNQNAGFI